MNTLLAIGSITLLAAGVVATCKIIKNEKPERVGGDEISAEGEKPMCITKPELRPNHRTNGVTHQTSSASRRPTSSTPTRRHDDNGMIPLYEGDGFGSRPASTGYSYCGGGGGGDTGGSSSSSGDSGGSWD